MGGYQWYPLAVQIWIFGVAVLVALIVLVILWFLWGRPLQSARLVVEQTEGDRQLVILEGQRRIDRIVERAEAEVLDELAGRRMRDVDSFARSKRPQHASITEVDDGP